jgi:hypothetical protein
MKPDTAVVSDPVSDQNVYNPEEWGGGGGGARGGSKEEN